METVVKDTASPRVLWHLSCPKSMLIFQRGRDFCLFFFISSHTEKR